MINYPLIATTFKTIDRLLFATFDAVGINMLKYNHDSSNVFRLVDAACHELESTSFDINYQMNMTLDNIDFVSIDRVNKFMTKDITTISYDKEAGLFNCDKIVGYSRYTNKEYDLKLCDNFLDFVRHSNPTDAFLETDGSQTPNYLTCTLQPEIEVPVLIKCELSRVTLNIMSSEITPTDLVSTSYNPKAKDNIFPYIIIKGLDRNYKEIFEKIDITQIENITSTVEFLRITSLFLSGLQNNVDVLIEPYVKNKLVQFPSNYIDREEQYEFNTVCTVDQQHKTLMLLKTDNTLSVLSNYNALEQIQFDLNSNDIILDYFIDNSNQIVYMVVAEAGTTKCLYAFPLIVPYSRVNLGRLKNTETQSVKVEYTKDTLTNKYTISVFPSEKAHGVDSVNILQREIYDKSRYKNHFELSPQTGAPKVYLKGDVVNFNNENWICISDRTVSRVYSSQVETDTRYFEDRDSSFLELENKVYWKKEVSVLKSDIVIDLLRFNIESNRFEFKFSDLFKVNDECIIDIVVNGVNPSIVQILVQNKKIKKFFSKPLSELFDYVDQYDLLFTDGTVFPVLNDQSELLVDKINSYKTGIIDTEFIEDFDIHYITSKNYVTINGYNIVPVFDSFYFDEFSKSIITSDTISHLFNPTTSVTIGGIPLPNSKALSGDIDPDPLLGEVMLSDKEDVIIFQK